MTRALIRKGDMTTHGGKVIEGFSDYTIQGIPVAGVGHKTICPLCKGVFPIVQGYNGITVNGILVALEGGLTACGAKLIPSQREEVVEDGGGGSEGYATLSDKPATQKSMINDGVYRPDQDKSGLIQTAGAEDESVENNYEDGSPIEPIHRRAEFSNLNSSLRQEWDSLNERYDRAYNKLHPTMPTSGSSVSIPDYVPTEKDMNDLRTRTENIERDANDKEQQDRYNKMTPEEKAQYNKSKEDMDYIQNPLERFKPKESSIFPKVEPTPKDPYPSGKTETDVPESSPMAPTDPSQNTVEIPQKALDTLKRADEKGSPFAGYKGGKAYANEPMSGDQKLPEQDTNGNSITYKEWDTDRKTPGVDRNAERIVTGSDGSAYYTNDHYHTFQKIR